MVTTEVKPLEYTLFIAIWDDELGAEVLDFCPKSSTGNLKSLSTDIFSTFEFFWKKSDETRKKTKTTLPIINLNKKARVVLDTLYNPDIGGFQSFVVVLLFPNYFSDQKIEVFDSVLLKISKKYINDRILLVKESYKDVEDIYIKEQEDEETSFEISDLYSFTAALDDFKAGVQLFQSRNFDDAYPLLRKALMKFEKEQNNNLILEALYLIASLFAQKKEFNIAEDYFRRLEALAEKMNHQKYGEISTFMTGFCSYKNERYVDAINQFLKIELFKKQFINEFQYYTFFGRALASLQNHEEAIKKLSFALRIIESQEQTPTTMQHKGQITRELGQIFYKQTLEKIKQFGIKNRKNYQETLDTAIDFFKQSGEIWLDIGEDTQLINIYKLIGDIHEFLGDQTQFFEFYNKALTFAEKSNRIAYQINILKRIIQKQALLGLHEENIKSIRNILDKYENYRLFDLHTAAILHKHLGVSLVKTDQLEEGLSELIEAYEILSNFKVPVDDQLQVLNRIIIVSTKLGKKELITDYTNKRDRVSAKLEEERIQKSEKADILEIIKDIWIFSKSTGIELFSYSYETEVEADLLGGFMTAIQAFSEQIAYKNIDSMIFGDARFSIYQEEDRDFYILTRSSATISEDMIEKVVSTVYNRFWKEFYQEIINFEGNVSHFQNFEKILESFDWTLIKEQEEVRIAPEQIVMKRREMKELVSKLPQDKQKLLVDSPPSTEEVVQENQTETLNDLPSAEELIEKATEKRARAMKQEPLFLDELKEEAISEEDVQVYKEQRICLVHKGTIEGFIFSCPGCGAFYCVKCVEALIDIENMCWSCEEVLDPNKPSQKQVQAEEEVSVIEESPEKMHKSHKKIPEHKGPKKSNN